MTDQIQLLDLTASFAHVSSPTPFGIYDNDTDFQSEANGVIKLISRTFGGSILQVELTNKDVYACLEQATLEYSGLVNSYHAKSILSDIIGTQTGSLDEHENKLARLDLALAKRKAQAYGTEALVGGTKPLFSSSIDLISGQQTYDLKPLLSASGGIIDGEKAEIREIFHFSPTAAYRFFDTTSAVNYLHNQFSFESFTPETIFYLLPIWEDVLRAQQLEQSHRIRRSNYAYNLIDNKLKIYPTPTSSGTLYFTYYKVGGPNDKPFDANDPLTDGISNLSNVPFGNISYNKLNSLSKQWIRRYAVALSKEVLGQVRSKVGTVPIPNSELQLNGPALIGEAREEMYHLKEELRNLLEATTYSALAEQEAQEAENLKRKLAGVPLGIFCGNFLLFLTIYNNML